MRVYLEAVENVESSFLETVEVEFIRLDITNRNFDEALKDLKSILDPNKHYTVQRHFCYHEEGTPCRVETIEEI